MVSSGCRRFVARREAPDSSALVFCAWPLARRPSSVWVAEDQLAVAFERGPLVVPGQLLRKRRRDRARADAGLRLRVDDASTFSTSHPSRQRSRLNSLARRPVRTSVGNTLRAWSSVAACLPGFVGRLASARTSAYQRLLTLVLVGRGRARISE